jgi:hypothetical protein
MFFEAVSQQINIELYKEKIEIIWSNNREYCDL